MMLCEALRDRIQAWLRDYDRLQYLAIILLYIQIACALVGSLGALYNGVLLINLAIALFALVAIESSSQSLGRTYAVLLVCAIFLDIFWILTTGDYTALYIFSVKLTLVMQIIGFFIRFSSSFLWIQIYRLGLSYVVDPAPTPRDADFDLRNSFLSPTTPTPAVLRQTSDSSDALGGSIYDPAYYSSLFEESQGKCFSGNGSTSAAEACKVKPSVVRSFQFIDEEEKTASQHSV
ncbi:uncharacterized protein LOC112165559 isoform X2 [Rosa chinensis]|uniref:uncharacterized protein LOC112165559 isoform X2 n=1 Tax=Rosa chinensis TaxID=74649 RepID=UPI001AD8EBE0|nr:uncharacterized protein LOC112165559 isoform X2 [Rosa chinensis]